VRAIKFEGVIAGVTLEVVIRFGQRELRVQGGGRRREPDRNGEPSDRGTHLGDDMGTTLTTAEFNYSE